PAAASSLDKPNAIAAQNLLNSSRPATGGRPGEGNGALPERSERRRFNLVIVTPHEALRRPLESAWKALNRSDARGWLLRKIAHCSRCAITTALLPPLAS